MPMATSNIESNTSPTFEVACALLCSRQGIHPAMVAGTRMVKSSVLRTGFMRERILSRVDRGGTGVLPVPVGRCGAAVLRRCRRKSGRSWTGEDAPVSPQSAGHGRVQRSAHGFAHL